MIKGTLMMMMMQQQLLHSCLHNDVPLMSLGEKSVLLYFALCMSMRSSF